MRDQARLSRAGGAKREMGKPRQRLEQAHPGERGDLEQAKTYIKCRGLLMLGCPLGGGRSIRPHDSNLRLRRNQHSPGALEPAPPPDGGGRMASASSEISTHWSP